jgi:hypothetical protein
MLAVIAAVASMIPREWESHWQDAAEDALTATAMRALVARIVSRAHEVSVVRAGEGCRRCRRTKERGEGTAVMTAVAY